METKSRYEVISDLEKQKRDLVRERDSLDEQLRNKESVIKNHERSKENLKSQQEDFDFNQKKSLQNLEREKEDWNIKMNNIIIKIDRDMEDAKSEVAFFKSSMSARKTTIQELIKGVDESLERFGKLKEK